MLPRIFRSADQERNTREAYMRAVTEFFDWCDQYEIGELVEIEPLHVATWVEMKTVSSAKSAWLCWAFSDLCSSDIEKIPHKA